ncbi:MAG: tyrosine-type recombinase/integrase [Nocardioides sp.]
MSTFSIHRQRAHDLADEPLTTPAPTPVEPTRTAAHQDEHIEKIVDRVAGVKPANKSRRHLGAHDLLTHLATLPGDGWAQRWRAFEQSLDGRYWLHVVLPGESDSRQRGLIGAALGLIVLDVIRPSYPWMRGSSMRLTDVTTMRDPKDGATLHQVLLDHENHPRRAAVSLRLAAQLQAFTGQHLRELDAQDLLDFTELCPGADAGRSGLGTLWRALHHLGWISHPSATLPPRRRRRGQLTCEEMVAGYGVDGELGEVLVEYLKHRTAGLDYPSRKGVARNLVKLFWRDVLDHHPDQASFAITRVQAEAWKQRIRFNEDGTPRIDPYPIMFTVRGFYLDVAQWALQDAYWAAWAAPSPIYARDLKGYAKVRREWKARGHQRTRELAPLLPQLVAQAEADRHASAAALAAAQAAGDGGVIEVDGKTWTVRQATTTSPLRIRDEVGAEVNVTFQEDFAFWSWAIIETLRHTGVRHEELLELTHLAIQPYTIPSTGETIPLIHIVPSKTDTERLILAGPELVHALAQVVSRVRDGSQDIPLTQRWDPHEKTLGPALPHLFVKRHGLEHKVISPNTIAKHIHVVAEKVENSSTGRAAHFTPHDLRRIFATDALSSGLPPHIVQVLMGHKSLATTQGYAAVYPQDVIRHHRTFIAQRRRVRPSEEYREPTPAEWAEFEAHFVTRKVSLGSCGRAYGTNCHHEHACVRCALLRPDPAQLDRLLEITSNLKDRITEAKDQGWLGEVEGLQISLTGAQHKLAQMQQQLADPDEPVLLGLPKRPRTTNEQNVQQAVAPSSPEAGLP